MTDAPRLVKLGAFSSENRLVHDTEVAALRKTPKSVNPSHLASWQSSIEHIDQHALGLYLFNKYK